VSAESGELRRVKRLQRYSRYIRQQTDRALRLYDVFAVLNGDTPLRSKVLDSDARSAALIFQDAILREIVLIVARLLDPYDKRRVTYTTVLAGLQKPGTARALVEAASAWQVIAGVPTEAQIDELKEKLAAALDTLDVCLDTGQKDPKGRLKILRAYRNQNLAHNLIVQAPAQLFFGYVQDLLSEIVSLTHTVAMAVEWVDYPGPSQQPAKSAQSLWCAVAEKATRDRIRMARSWSDAPLPPGRWRGNIRRAAKAAGTGVR